MQPTHALPPDSARRGLKFGRWVVRGQVASLLANASMAVTGAYYFRAVGVFIAVGMGVFSILTVASPLGYATNILWYVGGCALVALVSHVVLKHKLRYGNVYTLCLDRRDVEAEHCIATIYQQDVLLFQRLVSWRDFRFYRFRADTPRGHPYVYTAALAVEAEWPKASQRVAGMYPGLAGTFSFQDRMTEYEAFNLLIDVQVLAGRPDALTVRDAVLPQIN